jgi:hypothetical protein
MFATTTQTGTLSRYTTQIFHTHLSTNCNTLIKDKLTDA